MNITGVVAGNPRFHHIKTVLSQTFFNIPFQIKIVRSYRAAMFKFALCSHPDLARSKTLQSLLNAYLNNGSSKMRTCVNNIN